jgi:hypothetical protein
MIYHVKVTQYCFGLSGFLTGLGAIYANLISLGLNLERMPGFQKSFFFDK